MRSPFPGFPQEGIDFFRRLARNNRREWFLPRKSIFEEQVKQPMRELVEALDAALARFAPEHVTDPDRAIYRFYRDTRFSPDKSPYKDRIAATFPRLGLTRHEGASYYFSVSHKEVAIGGGVYLPTPETLAAIRHHIAGRHEEFRRIATARALRSLFGEMQGERLSRVPKGFPADHAAADLLRFKQFLFYVELPPEAAVTPALYDEIVKRFRAMAPFTDFLNAPLIGRRKKADALL
jgi:uncharacterized protein (TIGR02453 family)